MAREVHVVSKQVVVFNTLGRLASRIRNTLTIHVLDDVKRVHVGMILRAGVDVASLRPGRFTVVATNEETGTVTVDDACSIPHLCQDDALFWSAAEHEGA